jgi:hypothetical protein
MTDKGEDASLEEFTFEEALAALESSYRMGGLEAAQAVFRAVPAFHNRSGAPVHREWEPEFVRSVIVNEIQGFIARTIASIGTATDEKGQADMRRIVSMMMKERYGALVAVVPGLSLNGLSLSYNPRGWRNQ